MGKRKVLKQVEKVCFENTTGDHYKFYQIRIDRALFDVRLFRRWGRIGTEGRQLVEEFPSWREARKKFRELCRRRERHGYVRM